MRSLDRREVSLPGGGEPRETRPTKAPLPRAKEDDGLGLDVPGLVTESLSPPVSVILIETKQTATIKPCRRQGRQILLYDHTLQTSKSWSHRADTECIKMRQMFVLATFHPRYVKCYVNKHCFARSGTVSCAAYKHLTLHFVVDSSTPATHRLKPSSHFSPFSDIKKTTNVVM